MYFELQASEIIAENLKSIATSDPYKYAQLALKLSKHLNPILNRCVEQKALSLKEAIIAEQSEYLNEVHNISTGLKTLDKIMDGFARGELIVIGGRPGMGKTSLGAFFLYNIALQGHNCIMFNFEMNRKQTVARFMSLFTHFASIQQGIFHKVPYRDIQKKQIDASLHEKISDNFAFLDLPLHIVSESSLTINDIITKALNHAKELEEQGKRLDVVMIDYLQLIKAHNNRDAHLMIGDITGELKRLANDNGVTVILLSQLNRALESKPINERRPSLSDLRQSGKIEEDADKVIFPFHPHYYERTLDDSERDWVREYIEIIVAKNRSGEAGICRLSVDMPTNFYADNQDYRGEEDGMTIKGSSEKLKRKNKSRGEQE